MTILQFNDNIFWFIWVRVNKVMAQIMVLLSVVEHAIQGMHYTLWSGQVLSVFIKLDGCQRSQYFILSEYWQFLRTINVYPLYLYLVYVCRWYCRIWGTLMHHYCVVNLSKRGTRFTSFYVLYQYKQTLV